MKTVITTCILFSIVFVFLVINTLFLTSFFKETDALLSKIPSAETVLTLTNETHLAEIKKTLSKISNSWETKQTFLSLSLDHKASREFCGAIKEAESYLISASIPDFLSAIEDAKDTLQHLMYDESLCLGNLL